MSISSFFDQALTYGAHSPVLNPSNQGQKKTDVYLRKPIRALGRFAFGITAVTIIPTVGTFYHLAKAVQCAIAYGSKEKSVERSKAWKYLKAGLTDGFIAATHILALGVIPGLLANYIPKELAEIDRWSNPKDVNSLIAYVLVGGHLLGGVGKSMIYATAIAGSVFGAAALITPLVFTVFPDFYKKNVSK